MVRSPAMPEGFLSEDWIPISRADSLTTEEVDIFSLSLSLSL